MTRPDRRGPSSPLALRGRLLVLFGIAVGLLASAVILRFAIDDYATWVWMIMLSAVVWGGAGLAAGLGGPAPFPAWPTWLSNYRWLWLFGAVALITRLILMSDHSILSDDAFRYHWDGKVFADGINPYLHPPQHPALDHLRGDPMDLWINHPHYTTVYPPLTQLLFVTGYAIMPGHLAGFQLLCLAAEVATCALLARELRAWGLPPERVLLLLLCPLLIYETYLPGHTDVLALPFIVLLVSALRRRRALAAGAFLALACLIKPYALIFVPAGARELGLRRTAIAGAVWILIVAAFYLPFSGAGWGLFRSMWLMAHGWAFNGSLGALLVEWFPSRVSHGVAAAILAGLLVGGTWIGRDLPSRLLLAFAAFVICTPTLYPWYLIWGLPLLLLRPDAALLALAYLSPLLEVVNVRYRTTGVWDPPVWPSVTMYVPFYALLVLSAWRRRGMFGRGAPAQSSASSATRTAAATAASAAAR